MNVTKLAVVMLAATGLSTIATPVIAYEAGDWLIRGRIVDINPQDDSGTLSINGAQGVAGSGVSVDSDAIFKVDITYMIDRNWGAELILGYSKHEINSTGTISALGQVATTKALPPTFTLQYHFAPSSKIRPYIGAGVNYTYFFSEDVKGPLADGFQNAKVKMESSWGLAAQAGVDIAINDDWFVNLDIKYLDMDTTAKFSNTAAGSAKIDVDINPIVWGIGIGRRF